MHYITKGYIRVASLKEKNGLNHVESVKVSKKLMIRTGTSREKVGLVTEDVKNVTYQLLLKIKEKGEKWSNINFHPTVKSLELMQYLIRLICPPKGIVLDPFLGSGTTAIACLKENRKFIGIEKNEEYVKIAQARIRPFLEQTKLR